MKSKNRLVLIISLGIGIMYGLIARLFFNLKISEELFGVMTIAFIFVVPFVIGFLSVYLYQSTKEWNWFKALLVSLTTSLLTLLSAFLLAWEGLICIILMAPFFIIMSILGGLFGGITRRLFRTSKNSHFVLTGFLLLPYMTAPLENQFELPSEIRTVNTQIEIKADSNIIWNNIKRVPYIQAQEHSFSLTQLIGFPKPIEATLSHEGVGAIRHATFEGNVLFIETITKWEPETILTFSIRADTENIPSITFDEHVTVGGAFFDVLNGKYEIELIESNRAILHLSSQYRLSTRFNIYSSLWTDFIMRNTQNYILNIIKTRCELGLSG